MPAPIQLRRDFTAQQLRDLANAQEDESHARRLRAIAAILEGASRSSAAQLGGMERQTLRDWVHRFNMWGPDGLKSMRSPGRPPKLTDQQRDHLAKLIENSAGLSQPWRLADVVRLVRDAFEVELDEVTVGRLMKSLGYTYSGTRWRKDGSDDDDDDGEPAKRKPAAIKLALQALSISIPESSASPLVPRLPNAKIGECKRNSQIQATRMGNGHARTRHAFPGIFLSVLMKRSPISPSRPLL